MAIGVGFSSPGSSDQRSMSSLNHSTTAIIPPSNLIETIGAAIQKVEKHIEADSLAPQLADQIRSSPVSGLSDSDYPSYNAFSQGVPHLSSLVTNPLPSGLTEQFSHLEQTCDLGIFPEIHRAWLTIDSNLFLWNYDNGSDLAYYDSLNECIVSVGLIKPRKGVFAPHIKYLLCVCTTVEILLLGVTFTSEGSPEDACTLLLPEPIFTIPTDNQLMVTVLGTQDGRIFLGGKDSCIYEIVYQAEASWFRERCKKINHCASAFTFLFSGVFSSAPDPILEMQVDNGRHILYVRTERGSIEVYDLGTDGNSMHKVVSKSSDSIVQEAVYAAPSIDSSHFKPIVTLSVIEALESPSLHLVAVTQTGVRLYLSCGSNSEGRPTGLNLVHIRMPPGFVASSPNRPIAVNLALYRRGNSLFISTSQAEDRSYLWTMSSDYFQFESQLMEQHALKTIPGSVWRFAEEPRSHHMIPLSLSSSLTLGRRTMVEPPLLVTQHIEEPRKFIFLSNQGVHILYRMRPIDHLKQLLIDNQGYENEAVRSFFAIMKELQGCATALALALNLKSAPDKQIREWAIQAFFKYGGEPRPFQEAGIQPGTPVAASSPGPNYYHHGSPPSSPFGSPSFSSLSPILHSRGPGASSLAGPPVMSTPFGSPRSMPSTPANPALSGESVRFSVRHEALYLYLSRLLRPVWSLNVASMQKINTPEGPKDTITNAISSQEANYYCEKLNDFREFLTKRAKFTSSGEVLNVSLFVSESTVPKSTMMDTALRNNEATLSEKSSLLSLYHLLNYCIEFFGLYKILCDHQFHVVAAGLSNEYLNQLSVITFREMIMQGFGLAAALATSLVGRYIEDHATTDAISKRLQYVCPTIFKQESALHAKAHEMLLKAKMSSSKEERNTLVQEALTMCKKIGERINLTEACRLFKALNAYDAIVELCLSTADKKDPHNIALAYYNRREPEEDREGAAAFNARMEVYRVLLDFYEQLAVKTKFTIQPWNTGPSTSSANDPLEGDPLEGLSTDEIKKLGDLMLSTALKSNDQLFHFALYDWFYSNNQSIQLLDVKSPFLEAYLKRKTSASTDSESVNVMDLLWMYYERNGHFRAASSILIKLAERRSVQVPLRKRIEYLSRAIVCVKSSESAINSLVEGVQSTAGEFLHELQEKMDVARIQLQLLESLERRPSNSVIQDMITKLNSELYDISDLYSYAEKFNLAECQLAIIHCAGHCDPSLVETLWQSIIDNLIQEVSSQSPESQQGLLAAKLQALVKHYLPSGKFLPLEFILKYMEWKTHTYGFEPLWLCETLATAGLSKPQLLDLYHRMYRSREHDTAWPRKSVHLLRVLAALLDSVASAPSQIPSLERRIFLSKCQDVISGYLLHLNSLDTMDMNARQLSSQFKSILAKLDRCI